LWLFLGIFHHTLDEKGRLIMPVRFREALADGLVMTIGIDPCLQIYALKDWPSIEQKILDLPQTLAEARMLQRLVFGYATEETITKQGRILIPGYLREYAKIEKDVVVVGLSNRIEIWARETWQGYSEEAAMCFADIAGKLSNYGI
jgi:MraZ protein